MELAYRCRETPSIFRGRVEVDDEEGTSLLVYTDKRRVRVPLHDTYFAEPLKELFDSLAANATNPTVAAAAGNAAAYHGSEVTVELFGVLKAGRTQLRLRVASVAEAATAAGAGLAPISAYADATRGPSASSGGFGSPVAANAAPAAPADPDGALYDALRNVGVGESVVGTLQTLGLGRGVLLTTGAADLMGLTGCAPDEASTILMVAESLPAANAATSAAAPPTAPAADEADGDVVTAEYHYETPAAVAVEAPTDVTDDGASGRSPPVPAPRPPAPGVPAGSVKDEVGELDAEVLALLSRLHVSAPTVRSLAVFGIGIGAMRLLASSDLIEMVGCDAAEAQAIVDGVRAADTAAAAAAQTSVVAGAAMTADGSPLTASEVSAVLGYPIDDFQTRTLAVIVRPGYDLLAMAPTGSGKTAVALQAILQAFRRGKRAVYTSPIKALSNQKCARAPRAPPAPCNSRAIACAHRARRMCGLREQVCRVQGVVCVAQPQRGGDPPYRRHQDPISPRHGV